MSEVALPPEVADGQRGSAGALLRQAREEAGLHIGAMAVALKVPVKKIEALEADRLDLLPDAVFARALTGSICRHLKVDAAPILELLPQLRSATVLAVQPRLETPFHYGRANSHSALPAALGNPAVLVTGFLVMGAMALWLWPTAPTVVVNETPALAVANVMPSLVGLPGTEQSRTVVGAGAAANSATPATPASADPAKVVPPGERAGSMAPASALPTGSISEAIKAPDIGVSNPVGVVQFRASGQSWIEVTDATGTVQLRKTLEAGDTAGASGVLPLKVVVGRANLTMVQVRGQNFELLPLSKDNVARFEVRQ